MAAKASTQYQSSGQTPFHRIVPKGAGIPVNLNIFLHYFQIFGFRELTTKILPSFFSADAPGRVIVRLERLMGTDKIRITDAKYMSTLLERLEQEENEAWLKRTRERKQAERTRFRQLAVEGLMEPTADMEDLYNHPVFR